MIQPIAFHSGFVILTAGDSLVNKPGKIRHIQIPPLACGLQLWVPAVIIKPVVNDRQLGWPAATVATCSQEIS
jgi:hypothetical protein